MRSRRLVVLLSFFITCIGPMATAEAGEVVALSVDRAAICKEVVLREPVNSGIRFPVSVGRLYCFTKIVGAQNPTEIVHVWYYADEEQARVSLRVGSASWRTHSSKKIPDHGIGAWHVDVLSRDGEVLTTLQFEVTP